MRRNRPLILHYLEPHRFHPRPFDREGCSFRYSYYAQPWLLLSDCARDLRAMVIRGLFGWHYSDSWSADRYVLRLLPQLIRHIKAHHNGVPMYFCGGDGGDGEAGDPETVQAVNNDLLMCHIRDIPLNDKPSALDRSDARYCAWLEDKAQACEQWLQLLEDGPYGHLFTDEWHAAFRQVSKAHGLTYAFNQDGPLDKLSDSERQQLVTDHQAAFQQVCSKLHELIDHLYVVSD